MMRQFLKNNGLSLVLLGLFSLSLMGQSLAGWIAYNENRLTHQAPAIAYADYLKSAHFLEAVFENWESEFLQMGVFVALTVFLRQKGSPESKRVNGQEDVDKIEPCAGSPWPVKRGGWILAVYKNSLSIALLGLFFISLALHAITGANKYNGEQMAHDGTQRVTALKYIGNSEFWYESFQNWQSEFLSIAVLAVLAIYLRQKGSPESKPVAAPHAAHK